MAKLKLSDTIALTAFVVGIGLIGAGVGLVDGGHPWIKAGVAVWLLAFWVVLIENYLSGRPVRTRGGVVRPDDGRLAYTAPFVPLAVVGALALIMAIAF